MCKGYRTVEQRPWYSLGIDTTGKPHWWFRNVAGTDYKLTGYDNLSDATYSNRGPWHHIVGTYTAGTADLYVDGVHEVTLSVPNTGWGTGVQPFGLGILDGNTWGGPWLADVAIYPGQLSAAQVLSNFNLGILGNAFNFYQLQNALQAQITALAAQSADLAAILASVRKTY